MHMKSTTYAYTPPRAEVVEIDLENGVLGGSNVNGAGTQNLTESYFDMGD